MSRALLDSLYGSERRVRELQGAGDAFMIGLIGLIVAAVTLLAEWNRGIGLTFLALGGLLTAVSLQSSRRLLSDAPDGSALLWRYLGATALVSLIPGAIWLASAGVIWSIRSLYDVRNSGVDMVDFAAATPLVLAVVFLARPVHRVRQWQRRAFADLIRVVEDPRRTLRPNAGTDTVPQRDDR